MTQQPIVCTLRKVILTTRLFQGGLINETLNLTAAAHGPICLKLRLIERNMFA